jgi:uncharacterized membrane protein
MEKPRRFPAFLAYLVPILGSIYVLVFQRKNAFAVFHARQSLGLVIFIVGTFLAWLVAGYLLSLIPYMIVFTVSLFSLVISAAVFSIIAWIMGMVNALKGRVVILPLFGNFANSLPV